MVQARDELFLKLALRQGLFSQQEAVQFLHQYREDGAVGEGIGHWLVENGIMAEEQAAMIRSAIAQRAEGHVSDVRRRVPKVAKGGAGSGGRVAAAHHHHPVHHRHHAPRGAQVSGAQQAVYIASGVIALGLAVFLIIEFQKSPPPPPPEPVSAGPAPAATADELAERVAGGEAAPVSASGPATPQWTPQEIEGMTTRLNDAISLARSHLGDGRPGRGIETIQKRVTELGDPLPEAVRTLADAEIAELQKVVDIHYAEALTDLRAAKEKGNEDAIADLYSRLELSCGVEYVEKAKKALE